MIKTKCKMCNSDRIIDDNEEKEMIEEFIKLYGYFHIDDVGVICDKCFQIYENYRINSINPIINTPNRIKSIRKHKLNKIKRNGK